MVRITTLKKQKFSQSDPVLIRSFSKKLQSDPVLIRAHLCCVPLKRDCASVVNWYYLYCM